MKKLFAIILALLMLCSCGAEEAPVIEESQSEEEVFQESNPSCDRSFGEDFSEIQTEIYQIYGITTEKDPLNDYENYEFVLGTSAELERWNNAINNIFEVSKIVIHNIETEERELDFIETTEVINNLRALSPKIKPEMDNPATGGGFVVYAYDSEENLLWRVSPGYWFTVNFGGESIIYIFDTEGQDLSAINKIIDYRSPMSNP